MSNKPRLAPLVSEPTENITALFGALVRQLIVTETRSTEDCEGLTKVERPRGEAQP